ncbi:MAG: alpha-E domain-containing protein [Vicinamibacterales bacterium]
MLLSRVADALYWISRYLERAEHTARVVGVVVDIGLGRAGAETETGAISRLYGSLGLPPVAAPGQLGAFAAAALFDLTNQNSVVSCLTAARENARQVREEISADMWEQLNALFLRIRQLHADQAHGSRTHFVSRAVIDGIHLFQGTTDGTMAHGEGWQYLRAGRYIERAGTTAALVEAFVADPMGGADAEPLDRADWVALLRACAALEAYSRHYTADVRPERVAEFLLLNGEFPRSVRFAAAAIESALLDLGRRSGRRAGGRVERLSGRLHAALDYGQVDEILDQDPRGYLLDIASQCAQIHAALYQTYVTYPIESALPA